MRIALFSETFLPRVDGVTNTLCRLLEYLAARGHVSLLFAPAGGPVQYAKTQVVGLPNVPSLLYPDLRLVPPLVNVDAQLHAFRPDLIHVLNPVSLGWVGLWQARRLRRPVVASYHTDVPGFAAQWGLGIFQSMLWAYFRTIHNQADLNLCPSQFTRREIEAHGIRRVKVWGRGVDSQQFHPARRTPEWRARLSGGEPDRLLLLYVGRLSPEKRIHWLRPVIEALPQVRLAIVGDGPQRRALERLFAGTPTVFTGYLHGDELAYAYAAADLFVFPAANETLGNVVLEAMASGLAVVAPRSGGPPDHVQHLKTGVLFAPEQVDDLINAVTQLVRHSERAQAMGRAARRYAETNSWPAVLDGLLAHYTNLVKGSARSTHLTWGRLNPGKPKRPF